MDVSEIVWRKFKINSDEKFSNLFENELFVDVTLVCEDEVSVKAHKVILAASSELFKNILKKAENNCSLIYLHGIRHHLLKYVLNFIYRGEVKIPETDLPGFMRFTKELKLHGLLPDGHEESLEKNLQPQTTPMQYKDVAIINEERKMRKVNDFEDESNKENIEPDDEITPENEEDIYMDMRHSMDDLDNKKMTRKFSKRKREVKRYQNTLKDFEIYKKNFNKSKKEWMKRSKCILVINMNASCVGLQQNLRKFL